MIKRIICCCFCLCLVAQSNEKSNPGIWLRKSAASYLRVHIEQKNNQDDILNAIEFSFYVRGFLAVHRQNNMLTTIIYGSVTNLGKSQIERNSTSEAQFKTAIAFTPLLGLSEDISIEQIAAGVCKYLDSNPEKWDNNPEILLTDSIQMLIKSYKTK